MALCEQKAIIQVCCEGTLNCQPFITEYCVRDHPFRLHSDLLKKCSISVIRLFFSRSITLYTLFPRLHYVPVTSAITLHGFNYEEERSRCRSSIRKSYNFR
ncbi:hypothetical protein AMECASPLE_017061 [Ameca splendens]|uniref:SUEL-type lectin domain-containing protein n=1 Tax=Ameca splendens TaxID=208324 RepID=A0ABV0XRE5_9TELE